MEKVYVNAQGLDGNIFSVVGAVTRALKNAGRYDDARTVSDKLFTMGSYEQALAMCMEYAYFDFSGRKETKRQARPSTRTASENEMPAGTYIISDPCYILNEEVYDALLGTDAFDCEAKRTFGANGKRIWILHTKYGDGSYDSARGFDTFLVDSGTIACIEIDPSSFKGGWEKAKTFVANQPFECERTDEGDLVFGDMVTIQTGETECDYCGEYHCDGECQDNYEDEDSDDDDY